MLLNTGSWVRIRSTLRPKFPSPRLCNNQCRSTGTEIQEWDGMRRGDFGLALLYIEHPSLALAHDLIDLFAHLAMRVGTADFQDMAPSPRIKGLVHRQILAVRLVLGGARNLQ